MRLTIHLLLCLSVATMLTGCNKTKTTASRNYRTISVDPTRDTEAARRLHAQGLAYLDADELDKAQQAFTDSLTADPQFGPSHNNLGLVYYKNRDYYRAAHEFDLAIGLLPGSAEPHNNLGLALEQSNQAGRLDDAIAEYRQAVSMEPENMQYAGNLARALIRRGDRTDETRALLEKLIAKDTRADWLIWAKQTLAGFAPAKP